MGYSCPVCGDPQADEEHLANHLAFTAMIHGGDHEAFLDDHVPEWASLGEDQLGDVVSELADDEEYPQVFEDTTDSHSHDHAEEGGQSHDHSQTGEKEPPDRTAGNDLPPGGQQFADSDVDEPPADILAEAQELTRKRHETNEDTAETDENEPTESDRSNSAEADTDGN